MIDIHVQGSAWLDVTQELRRMLGDEPQQADAECTDFEELERQIFKMGAQLNAKCARIAELEEALCKKHDEVTGLASVIDEMEALIREKNTRIEELEKLLADAEAANPTPTGATTADTETNAPGTGTAPAKTDEIEQTEIPEVTEAPVKEFKKEEVRAVLMKCRAANITISDILAPYGGSLGAVKKEDYAKVIEAAEAALAEVKVKEDA